MLRHDSESSRPGLGRKIIRTWFQAIFDFQKILFLVLQFVFSKIATGGPTKPWNLCSKTHQKSNFWCRISHHHLISPYHITIWYLHITSPYDISIWYLHMISTYPKKAIYDIGTKILFGASVSHKPIKNWEIENVKTWFWKLSTSTIFWHCQNVI